MAGHSDGGLSTRHKWRPRLTSFGTLLTDLLVRSFVGRLVGID